MKKKKSEKPIDEIREVILRFFYDRHKKASSPKKLKLKISEAKTGLKELGISSAEAISNIEYLIDGGWLKKEVEEKKFTTRSGVSMPSETSYYKASIKTIDHFDNGESIFKKKESGGINITNIQGVTNVINGEGNTVTVNSKFENLYGHLDKLSQEIKESNIGDESKLNYVSEVETIKSQLQKPQPDKTIVHKAWGNLKGLASVAGSIAAIYTTLEPLVKALLH